MTTNSPPTLETMVDNRRPVDAHALLHMAFQEMQGDAVSNDGNPLMDARLGLLLMIAFCVQVVKVLCTSLSGAFVSDRSAAASTAYCFRVDVGMVGQQCAQMREPHAAHMREPCAAILLSPVSMPLIAGLSASSKGVVVGLTMDSVVHMVDILNINPPDVLTSPSAQKLHLWQKG